MKPGFERTVGFWLLLGVVSSSVGVVYLCGGFVVASPRHPRAHRLDDPFLREPSGYGHDQHEVALQVGVRLAASGCCWLRSSVGFRAAIFLALIVIKGLWHYSRCRRLAIPHSLARDLAQISWTRVFLAPAPFGIES